MTKRTYRILKVQRNPPRFAGISEEAYEAIKRALYCFKDDQQVLNYAVGPHEGVTIEHVREIRRRLKARRAINSKHYITERTATDA